MKRSAPIFTVIFATGILLGMIVNQALNAQQAPLKVIELLKTDVAGMEGKEIIVELVEFAIIGFFP